LTRGSHASVSGRKHAATVQVARSDVQGVKRAQRDARVAGDLDRTRALNHHTVERQEPQQM